MFDDRFPNIADFVARGGWFEVGDDEGPLGFVRAVEHGGLVWESKSSYTSLEAALQDLEKNLVDWLEETA
jgi:hypothetical protein